MRKGEWQVSNHNLGIAQLRDVAKWYYQEDVSKKKILERLNHPNPGNVRPVKKWLERAKRLGVVRIQIPETVKCDCEEELSKRFHLRKIIAVPRYSTDTYLDLLRKCGVEAASYFDTVTAQGQHHVGVTGGGVVLEFCEALGHQRRDNIHIYTLALIGRGHDRTGYHIDPLVNASILLSKCGHLADHCNYATVPPYDRLDRQAITTELDLLAKRKPIQDAIKKMNKITMAIGSIGLIQQDPVNTFISDEDMMMDLLEPLITPQQLASEGACGDFAYCPFDRDGKSMKNWRFFLTPGDTDPDPERRGIEFYKHMVKDGKTVVAIVGPHRDKAVYAALKAGIFNVLITDHMTVEGVHKCWMLDEPKKSPKPPSA